MNQSIFGRPYLVGREVVRIGRWNRASSTAFRIGEAISMTEPTEDEILVKAKKLAHDDCRLWDTKDVEEAPWERNRFVGDALRAKYLNRARKLLRHEKTWTAFQLRRAG
jgi:hypothetical protein